jgi:hypothetical protein
LDRFQTGTHIVAAATFAVPIGWGEADIKKDEGGGKSD